MPEAQAEATSTGRARAGGMGAQIARTAAGLESAVDAEVWASQLLGTFPAQRCRLPLSEALETDPALLCGRS